MFYDLTEQQVQNIKTKMYPQQAANNTFLKNVIVNDYGSDNADNSIRIIYSFKDGLENNSAGEQIFKVFNNLTAKKYMRLKLFEIKNENMLPEVTSAAKDIAKLEAVISKYGALSRDLTPSLDFSGDKVNPDAHLRIEEANNSIELSYDTTFLLSRPKIEYFTLGAIFYLDKNEYIADQKVDQRFIDERILVDRLLTYELYRKNKVIKSAPVQDLRLVKSVFQESNYLDNILSAISKPSGFSKALAVKQYTEEPKIPIIPFDSENLQLTRVLGVQTLISRISLKPKRKNNFSNVFYSRNYTKELGMLFSINFEEILKDNTAFKNLLTRSSLKEEFFKKCKLSTINIVRRQVKNDNKGSFFPRLETTKAIISSGEAKDKNEIQTIDNDDASLREITLNTSSNFRIRTFTATDKRVFSGTSGYYQYGIELEITNAINEFLLSYADSLMPQISGLKEYLEETNKIAKVVGDDVKGYSLQGSYDPQKNAFTPIFIKNFARPRNSAPSFQQIIINAVANFTATIKMFGLMKESEEELNKIIVNMLAPNQTRAETIIYFIKIYERLISQIRNLVKDNYNNSFTIKKWFTNDYVDTNSEINTGYNFINFNDYQGLGVLNSSRLRDIINSTLDRYSIDKNLDTTRIGENDFAYVAPSDILSVNKILSLANLNKNPKAISDLDFAEMEIEIKNTKLFGSSFKQPTVLSLLNRREVTQKAELAAKSNKFLESFAAVPTEEVLIELPSVAPIVQNQQPVKNEKIDESDLMLALSKQIDLAKNSFGKAINKPSPKVSAEEYYASAPRLTNTIARISNNRTEKIDLTEQNTETELSLLDMPIYVRQLLDDKNPILKSADNYKKSLKLNSKFQFLFNTLHVIEILEYNSNTLQERWSLLTKSKLDSLPTQNLHLCRLRNYKNARLGIDGIEQIKMPIYSQYFLFSKSNLINVPRAVPTGFRELTTTINQTKIAASSTLSNLINRLGVETPTAQPASANQQTTRRNPFSSSRTNKK